MVYPKWPLCLSHTLRSVKVAGQFVPKDGVLHVNLPKTEDANPGQIEVKIG